MHLVSDDLWTPYGASRMTEHETSAPDESNELKWLGISLVALFACFPIIALLAGAQWGDMSRGLGTIRSVVDDYCHQGEAIFLDLQGNDHKLRQVLSLYLDHRVLKSNWDDDGYFGNLVRENVQRPAIGDCLIEPRVLNTSPPGIPLGRMSLRKIGNEIRIGQPNRPYVVDHDDKNTWVWSGPSVTFEIQDFLAEPREVPAGFQINGVWPFTLHISIKGETRANPLSRMRARACRNSRYR